MRIVFAGTPEFAVPSLHALVKAAGAADPSHDVTNLEVVGVITREDAPLGRKRVLTPSPVAQAAAELGLPVFKANKLDENATEWVRELGADLGVIVAYGGLVREPLLSLPHRGWINLHFSTLPNWRGAAPVQRALMAGEQELGVTVFRLVAALDAGAVLTRDQKSFTPGTSAGEALTELASFGTDALLGAVQALASDADAGDEQQGEPSYAHKLGREDGKIDLTLPTASVLAHWAGVTPEPGAYVLCEDQPLKLHKISTVDEAAEPSDRLAGTVQMREGKAILDLVDGALELERVQPAGKAAMNGADWLRGRGGSVVLS
ncbi:methionyl-tRNA formyltransferase [Leucobacter sp. UT-8R-CII-1-4]|uniref:methionyl-tRNA formyltransferase n=1 Tax=Leucobacter sp. UT-8R-CII-1-4 TaxID=3040075 RepID=UPI0024A80C5C|nr:methionyl-tRNA formyltransferase [Leucobacter sp. UT-8R-CII-1-4]MDI6024528.1 methionyl-tRNA formyltransferase [Leucobacter sp. UT-8R-CII-1-4]